MTRDQLLADLLLERYQPTRAEDVAGSARAVPVDWEDHDLITAKRRRVLREADTEHRKRGAA